MKKIKYGIIFMLIALGFSSCLTYYQVNADFYSNFESGRFLDAEKAMLKDKKGPNGRNKLLYYLNLGTATSLMGQYERSNDYFEQAYIITDDYVKNYLAEAASILINPNIAPYKGEDFELLYLHYYKALNYLKMNQPENALVECRRMNIRLNTLSDRYKEQSNKFRRDAFIHLLMGIIYEANQEINNAFIAYRNALEIYEEDYKEMFDLEIPQQLKYDVIRTAHAMGFEDDVIRYEEKYNIHYTPDKDAAEKGTLIFLWHNGLGPIKTETTIDFSLSKGDTEVTFSNSDLGMVFSFEHDNMDDLKDLNSLTVAFPQYIERPPLFKQGEILWKNQYYPLELGENMNRLAFKSLQQRMWQEMSKALLRLALREAAEAALRSKDKGAAALFDIVSSFTVRADTRAWQAIPHSIYYRRIPMSEGEQKISFIAKTTNGSAKKYDFSFSMSAQKTIFHTFHSLESD
ncbi:MAG: hypothetical protein EAZ55_13965 [Cytophagales bacterium]|nr:MAG: hypothetical protein EAZ55_13965 [Cytophagales bacterium]